MIRKDFLEYCGLKTDKDGKKMFSGSYAGIDGGDINAEYWFMGMEWSDIRDIDGHYDFIHNKWQIISKIPKGVDIKANRSTWKLENKLDILYHMIMPKFAGGRTIFEEDSNTLKLNLLPLPFLNQKEKDNWEKTRLPELTGIDNFESYKNEVIEARSKLFEKLSENGKQPKTVFCFGTTYTNQLLRAFKIDDNVHIKKIMLPHFQKDAFVYYPNTSENNCLRIKKIVVCPFPYVWPYGPANEFDEADWQTISDVIRD